MGEPTACQHQGRYFQLSDVMGVDREMGFSLSTDKYNTCDPHHFILEDESFTGKIDFGEVRPASTPRASITRSWRRTASTASWW